MATHSRASLNSISGLRSQEAASGQQPFVTTRALSTSLPTLSIDACGISYLGINLVAHQVAEVEAPLFSPTETTLREQEGVPIVEVHQLQCRYPKKYLTVVVPALLALRVLKTGNYQKNNTNNFI